MTLELTAVAFDAADPSAVAAFWGSLLDRVSIPAFGGALLPGSDTQVGLHFVESDAAKTGPNRLHLHLTSTSSVDQQSTVSRALELGGRHVDVGQRPDEEHVVLADPGGNEFCVIEPGNGFLDGCGFLAEVSHVGSRDVGLFWHDALGWPLVWDRDGETAIQSPHGGTKLSWDGPPVPPKAGRNRQRFVLVADDLTAQSQRLAALGASPLGERDEGLEMADPDGNEFFLLRD